MGISDKSIEDILGIKPYGEALKIVVDRSFDGAAAFLSKLCLPATGELGLLLKNQVEYWRLNNIIKMLNKAKGKMKFKDGQLKLNAHPRLAIDIIDSASWQDVDFIQELWAGLLISSCTLDGKNDDNLIFINLLKQLTASEAKIIQYICKESNKVVDEHNFIYCNSLTVDIKTLSKLTNIKDIHRIDRELDHLRSIELIPPGGGFSGGMHSHTKNLIANIPPSNLCLNLYIRCQGKRTFPAEYWNVKYKK